MGQAQGSAAGPVGDGALGSETTYRARVCRHREIANVVLDALSLAVLLGLADPCDLWGRKEARGQYGLPGVPREAGIDAPGWV